MAKISAPRLALAWILSAVVSYFTLGFLGNIYRSFFEIFFLTLFFQSFLGFLAYLALGKAADLRISQPLSFVLVVALFAALTVFAVAMVGMAWQFPSLFDPGYVLLENQQRIPFLIGFATTFPCLMWSVRLVKQSNIKETRLFLFLDQALAGLLVAGFFFAIYLVFAAIFNQPAFDVDDIFFDTDGLLWRTRFTTVQYQDYYWRSVHPFVLLIVRPMVTVISAFLKGNKLAAAFLLTAFAGATCVFLVWYFVKHTVGNQLYALLIASIFGASAAHLVFGSLIETYIFLSAVTLVFLVLLLKDRSLFIYIFLGLISFGITITNFIQTVILFIFVKRDVKQWIKFGVIVVALTIPLTLLNNLVYPDSQPYFFAPSSFGAEAENTFVPTIARGMAITRVMFLHSIVAPDPLILDEEIPFLKVWIFKADPIRLSGYKTWYGSVVAAIWVGFMLFGGFNFLRSLLRSLSSDPFSRALDGDNRFFFALILILLFNFALHLRYGKDVFLYAANWTYTIILFLALAWKEHSGRRWFQLTLLIFLALLMANNSRLIFTMLSTSALHIK